MRYFILSGFVLFVLATIYSSFKLSNVVHERKMLMEDYAEINKANYELFNIQLWKEKSLHIMQNRIRAFNISQEGYDVLNKEVQKYLEGLYAEYIKGGELIRLISQNLEKDGKINKMFIQIIKDNLVEQIQKLDLPSQIPGMSQQVVQYVRDNEPMLKAYMHQELLRLVIDDQFQNYVDKREILYNKYQQKDLTDTDSYLVQQIKLKDNAIQSMYLVFIILMVITLVLAVSMSRFVGFKEMVASLTLSSVILLVLGISLPMIDIDARLNSFTFDLLGEKIEFDEQIIYYQSKSIVEVTKTLWQGEGWDLKMVGVLVLMFSIVFPFFKLLLSGLYLFFDRIRKSSLARGFIFYLGKWSMADVFVVAMFMAYIGMYGVIASQLNGIGQNQGGFAIETVNYSRLSPGAFFFTAYTILSICISILINRNAAQLNSTE